MLTGGLYPGSAGPEEAQLRGIGLLGQQVGAQAYTLATADGFILAAWIGAAYLVLMLFLRPAHVSFKDLRKMQ